MDPNVTRESVMITESDEELTKFAFLPNVSKNAKDYPEAFVEAIRNSAVKSILTTSGSCSPRSSYTSKFFKMNIFCL